MNTKVLSVLAVVVAALCGWLVVAMSQSSGQEPVVNTVADQTGLVTNPTTPGEGTPIEDDSVGATVQVGASDEDVVETSVEVLP